MTPPPLPALLAARAAGTLARRAEEDGCTLDGGLWARIRGTGELSRHRGCVNHLSFNAAGTRLYSSGDDRVVCVWDVATRRLAASRATGHTANVFCVRVLPESDDRRLATCAGDGTVRVHALDDGPHGAPALFASHRGRVKKLATEPGCPSLLLSAAEDGTVRSHDLRAGAPPAGGAADVLLAVADARGHALALNSVSLAPLRPHLVAVGGGDACLRVFDRRMLPPPPRAAPQPLLSFDPTPAAGGATAASPPPQCRSCITGVCFSHDGRQLLGSYLGDAVYLFDVDAGLPRGQWAQRFQGHCNVQTVKDVGFLGARQECVASGSDGGRLFVWRRRDGRLLAAPRGDAHAVNCAATCPGGRPLVASCGIDATVKLWEPLGDAEAAAAEAATAAEAGEARRRVTAQHGWSSYAMVMALHQTLLAGGGGAAGREEDGDGPWQGAQAALLGRLTGLATPVPAAEPLGGAGGQ